MEEKQAIFTAGEYYLLPEGFKTFDEFAKFVSAKKTTKLKLTKLSEIKCMSPYFTDKAKSDVTVTLSSENPIFKTKVFLLGEREYHDRLVEIIKAKCLDCDNFIDDGDYEELNGHYEEVSLDSVCFKKRIKGFKYYYVFAYANDDIVNQFNNSKTEIEKCIDSGNTKEAKEKFFSILKYYITLPIDVIFAKRKKCYECFFPTFSDDAWALMYYYICKYFNGKIVGWKFYPYLPQGIIAANKEHMPTVFEDFIEVQNVKKHMLDFSIKEESMDSFAETYLYLCADIGEDVFLRETSGCLVGFSTEKPGHEIPYAEFKKSILKNKKSESLFKDKSPVPIWLSVVSYDENGLPNKIASYCSNLFFECFDKIENVFSAPLNYGSIMADFGVGIARLSINVDSAIYAKNITFKLILALDKMLDNDFSVHFAREILPDKLNIYFLVFNREKFLYELKRHSPIFETYSATLEIADKNERKTFEVSQLFKLVASESVNSKKD